MTTFIGKKGEIIDLSTVEKLVSENIKRERGKELFFDGITSSKLRNLLSLVNNIYTKAFNEHGEELSDDILDEILYLKIKYAYEAGRDKAVKTFIENTNLSYIVDQIIQSKSKKDFKLYCRYFEGIVAYCKFYGMRDK